MISKSDARKTIKDKRKNFPPKELLEQSKLIADLIIESAYFKEAETVMCYASIRGEVDTFYLMEKILEAEKLLALPVTEGKEMTFYQVNGLDELTPGYMGIAEPKRERIILPDENTLMIMPGVAFDIKCHRTGYGAGCYDRYLVGKSDFIKIAPAFEFQIFEKIENDEFDICPDIVILPDGRKFLKDDY